MASNREKGVGTQSLLHLTAFSLPETIPRVFKGKLPQPPAWTPSGELLCTVLTSLQVQRKTRSFSPCRSSLRTPISRFHPPALALEREAPCRPRTSSFLSHPQPPSFCSSRQDPERRLSARHLFLYSTHSWLVAF